MTKLLKLINDERKLVNVKAQKGCDASSTDTCITLDRGSNSNWTDCLLGAYDYCTKDYAGCYGSSAYDSCTIDNAGCAYSYDICGVDW